MSSSSASEQQQPAKIQETYQFHSPGKVTFAHETDEEKPKWTNCEISHVGDVTVNTQKKGRLLRSVACWLSRCYFIVAAPAVAGTFSGLRKRARASEGRTGGG